jgi:hypothetical protein
MDEDIIGIIWGVGFHFRHERAYCALLITNRRVVGAKLETWSRSLVRYLSPGSNVSQEDRNEAEGVAWEIDHEKRFEFSKDGITEISYRPVGFSDGRVSFRAKDESVEVRLVPRFLNPRSSFIWRRLILSLTTFAPDKLHKDKD